MELSGKFFDYLKSKLNKFEKTTKKGGYLFTCPNIANHKVASKGPSATFISGSDKIKCLQCGWKGTFFDVVRLLESDKQSKSDADITCYLMDEMKIDAYAELDTYVKYVWALVPIAKNSKTPIEKDWTNITHYDKLDWIKWLNNGLNIGLRTGEVSKITVIDVDLKIATTPEIEEILTLLNETKTLTANTPHGLHFVFQYDKDIAQVVNASGLHIDTRNDGGQIVVQPSQIDALGYHWKNLGVDIKIVPENVKVKLLQILKIDRTKSNKVSSEMSPTEAGEISVVCEGGRNNVLTSIGGLLVNKFTPEQTEFILNIISRNFMKPPLPTFEIKNMMGSLTGYKASEDASSELAIYEYLKQIQNDVNAKDVMDSLKLNRAIVDKYLSKFVKEGKAIRLSRGRYKYREKIEWSDKLPASMNPIAYKIPYFDFLQDYEEGDIIILGGQPGHGKTTTSINIIKQLVDQGIKPFYVFSEAGSRHYKIAQKLGLVDGEQLKFYTSYHGNPLSIEIEPHAITILDWLLIAEKENTDMIFKHFTEEMERKGGILIVMSQLKKDYNWYAPNMIDQFPALAARYILDSEDRKTGHWQIDKVRDSRLGVYTNVIPCEFDLETKILTKKDLI